MKSTIIVTKIINTGQRDFQILIALVYEMAIVMSIQTVVSLRYKESLIKSACGPRDH